MADHNAAKLAAILASLQAAKAEAELHGLTELVKALAATIAELERLLATN